MNRTALASLALPLLAAVSACNQQTGNEEAASSPESEASAAPQTEPSDFPLTFPREVQGKWRESVGPRVTDLECDGYKQENMGKVLTIREDGYSYFETGGRLEQVFERDDNLLIGLFDTTYADEKTEAKVGFEVQGDQDTLIQRVYANGDEPGEPTRYLRCPDE